MAIDNQVTIIGNVTRDPEVRHTPTGLTVVQLGIACNDRKKVGDQWEDIPNFFDVVVFSELGMNVADTIHKGDRAIVVGKLRWSSWENDKGEKRTKVEIVADEVAPSLKWAVANVKRTKQTAAASRDPHAGVDAARAAINEAKKQWNDGEEPF